MSAFDHDSILFIDCLCTPIPATIATSVMSNKDKQAARAKGKHSYYEQIIQPWIAGTSQLAAENLYPPQIFKSKFSAKV